jgi:hypothetical protein
VKSAITYSTNFGVTATTSCILSSSCEIDPELRGLDPLAAALLGTIQSICRGILLIFPVPSSLEFVVEKTLDDAQGYVVRSAALGRHMLRVIDREHELTLETCMTHAMPTGEFRCFGSRQLVCANKTFDPWLSLEQKC